MQSRQIFDYSWPAHMGRSIFHVARATRLRVTMRVHHQFFAECPCGFLSLSRRLLASFGPRRHFYRPAIASKR